MEVLIVGISGRMGREIGKIVHNVCGMEIIGGIEKIGHPLIGHDVGEALGLLEITSANVFSNDETKPISNLLNGANVVIDFSNPESTIAMAALASEKKVPMVIGTTGLTAEDLKYLKDCSKNIPILQSFNMSLGMNLLFSFVATAAKILAEYDAEILEKHHDQKKDAPSGSAIKLGQIIAEARNNFFDEKAVYSRHGLIGVRVKNEIGIQTIRGGNIVGEHTVFFIGQEEILEITHKAASRILFARGAVEAAQWICGQVPGLYTMQDFLTR